MNIINTESGKKVTVGKTDIDEARIFAWSEHFEFMQDAQENKSTLIFELPLPENKLKPFPLIGMFASLLCGFFMMSAPNISSSFDLGRYKVTKVKCEGEGKNEESKTKSSDIMCTMKSCTNYHTILPTKINRISDRRKQVFTTQ